LHIKELLKEKLLGTKVEVLLSKPYTLYSEEHGALYCRTGTMLKFDSFFWNMYDCDSLKFRDCTCEVEYDIPGKKSHSRHTTGTFTANVNNVRNIIYVANKRN
jgi:hypothetical protein